MTPETRAALEALLPEAERGRGEETDLVTAARAAVSRREDYARQAGAVIAALRELDVDRWSWRAIEAETGIPHGTARRWVKLAIEGDQTDRV